MRLIKRETKNGKTVNNINEKKLIIQACMYVCVCACSCDDGPFLVDSVYKSAHKMQLTQHTETQQSQRNFTDRQFVLIFVIAASFCARI